MRGAPDIALRHDYEMAGLFPSALEQESDYRRSTEAP